MCRYGHGIPERVFAAVPGLHEATCRIFARQADAKLGLHRDRRPSTRSEVVAAFGEGTDAADLAFIYVEGED